MPRLGPGARAEIGSKLLAAAARTDTQTVRRPLGAFAAVHGEYTDAQEQVAALEKQLAVAQRRLAELDTVLRASIDDLARALVMAGRPRLSPFRGLGAASPAVLQRFAMARKANAVRRLVAAVQRMRSSPRPVLDASAAAASAADNIETGLGALDAPQAALRNARMSRDVIGRRWDRQLAALRHHADAARDDGAPQLRSLLFHGMQRMPSLKRGRRRH